MQEIKGFVTDNGDNVLFYKAGWFVHLRIGNAYVNLHWQEARELAKRLLAETDEAHRNHEDGKIKQIMGN